MHGSNAPAEARGIAPAASSAVIGRMKNIRFTG
jgi:hypothetical protein